MKSRSYDTCDLMHGNICVSEPCICKGMAMSKARKNKKNPHGGKRKGSGRKKGVKFKEPTVVKRIPISKIEEVKNLINKKK